MEAGDGIEPTIKALQASALPLCYPAKNELNGIVINKIIIFKSLLAPLAKGY
jgi:hypothetical protein